VELVAERGLQVTHVLLCVLPKGPQRFGHISQSKFVRLGESLPIPLQLPGLQPEVDSQRTSTVRCASTAATSVVGEPPRNETCSARI
jgi:hypothetical protein